MKLKTFIRQAKRRINFNIIFFSFFAILLIFHSYFKSGILFGYPIWTEIFIGAVIYYFGYRYIKEVENFKEKKKLKKKKSFLIKNRK